MICGSQSGFPHTYHVCGFVFEGLFVCMCALVLALGYSSEVLCEHFNILG